jgi:hypothetical protein
VAHYSAPMSSAKLQRICRSHRVALVLTALLCAGPAPAEPGETYGERFALAGEASAPAAAGGAGPTSRDADSAAADLAVLRERVRDVEQRGGPYAAGLAESLADLARAEEALGNSGAATTLRQRALHLTRLNDGLYSEAQLPLLRELFAADRRRGDFETLDGRYDYYFRLLGSGRPPFTALRFAAALEYQRWQREALLRELGGETDRLLRLIELGDALVESLATQLQQMPARAENRERYRRAGLSQLANFYLFAARIAPEQAPERAPATAPRFPTDPTEFDLERERLLSLRRSLKRRGDDLLQALEEAADPAVPGSRARLALERGDWLQWWGAYADAREHYRRSWRMLEAQGDRLFLDAWFGEPRPLPDNGVFRLDGRTPDAAVTMRVAVDARGRAQAEFLDAEEGLSRLQRRLPRLLRNTRFRPAMADGDTVAGALDPARFVVFD